MAVDRSSLSLRAAEGKTGIPVALSSDNPIQLWPGCTEVLVHTKAAIDMTYAKNGLPLLLDHNVTKQIGWLSDLELGTDGVLRAIANPGSHPDAEWAFRDMENGIRPYISIGYDPLEWQGPNGSADGEEEDEQWTITRWMPLESSTIAIPADVTVGVGRSAELAAARATQIPATAPAPKERNMTEEERRAAEAAERQRLADAATELANARTATATAERERATATELAASAAATASDMRELATLAHQNARADLLPSWIERGISPKAAMAELLEAKRGKPGARNPIASPGGEVDMGRADEARYSVVRALAGQLRGKKGQWEGLEFEVSDEIAKRLGRDPVGVFIPLNVAVDPTRAKEPGATRASITGQQVAANGDGGYTVETQVMPLIELLRNRMVVKSLGATVLTGLMDNLQFPRQTSGNTLTWVGENPAAANANTKAALDIVTMSPKTAQIDTAFSRRLLAQSSFDVEQFVRNDLALVGAIGLDSVAINGSGSANQPLGLLNTSGIGSVAMGTNGGLPTWPKMAAFLAAIQAANADVGDFGWLFTPETVADLLTIPKATNQAVFIMADNGTVINYKSLTTNQLPKTLTKGTTAGTCHAAILGVWPQLMIGEWGSALDVLVDPFTGANQNMIAIHAYMMVDVACRHPAAFCASLDITP